MKETLLDLLEYHCSIQRYPCVPSEAYIIADLINDLNQEAYNFLVSERTIFPDGDGRNFFHDCLSLIARLIDYEVITLKEADRVCPWRSKWACANWLRRILPEMFDGKWHVRVRKRHSGEFIDFRRAIGKSIISILSDDDHARMIRVGPTRTVANDEVWYRLWIQRPERLESFYLAMMIWKRHIDADRSHPTSVNVTMGFLS